MSFLDRLSGYLQEVESPRSKPPSSVVLDSVEPVFARKTLIRCLERLEESGGDDGQAYVDDMLRRWNEGDAIVEFVNRLSRLLSESIGNGLTKGEMEEWLEIAIARHVGLDDSLDSRIRTMELDRLSGIAFDATFFNIDFNGVKELSEVEYSAAIRATRRFESKSVLTAIGRVFLEMKGRDAIRWLLHVETAQSFGLTDPWRISRDMAYDILNRPCQFGWPLRSSSVLWKTAGRLVSFGLALVRDDLKKKVTVVEVLPVGRQLLLEIVDRVESPMSVLAESVVADIALSAASNATDRDEKTTGNVQSSAVAEATVRHSRLVAHEIRNMLVPVKTSLNALYREVLLSEQPQEVVNRRRDGIDRGIDSVFRFVGQLVELSQFVAVPSEPFDVLSAIRDAVSTIEAESGMRIEQVLPMTLPPVSGHRARMVTALANVLRNATQFAPPETPSIRIEAEALAGVNAVRIAVEDNGPGVAEPMRRAIFDEGVSLRGGSGLGLALVREVFEKEMRGLVTCDSSPLGGARFVIRVPTTGTER